MGSALIRVLNSQQPESMKFLETNFVSRNLGLSILRLFATLIPVIMFVANLAVVTILALGGHFVVAGTMSLGNFAAFNSYLLITDISDPDDWIYEQYYCIGTASYRKD